MKNKQIATILKFRSVKIVRVFFILAVISGAQVKAQNFDSLELVYNNTKLPLKQRLQALDDWSWYIAPLNPDSSILLGEIQIKKAKSFPLFIAKAYNNMGQAYMYKSDYPNALKNYNNALIWRKKLNDPKGEATVLNNLGTAYYEFKDYKKAIVYFRLSCSKNSSIGLDNENGLAYSNMGGCMLNMEQSDSAAYYFKKSIKISNEVNDLITVVRAYNNICQVYINKSQYDSAIYFLTKAEYLNKEINHPYTTAHTFYALARTCFKQKKYDFSISYAQQAYDVFKQLNHYQGLRNCSEILSDCYIEKRNYELAASFLKELVIYNDCTFNDNKKSDFQIHEVSFQYQKKQLTDSLERVKKDDIQKADLRLVKTRNYFLISGLALLVVFIYFLFRKFKTTKQQKRTIERQKALVEEKHKEITDSINYAERIQRSFLATKELLDENLKDYFVFFRPKDVVSGDFYFASKLSNGDFVYVTADSTGHGVPGAIMSIANISCLKESITKGKIQPADILNETRRLVIDYLKNDGSADGGKDGMDASLILLNKEKTKLIYAAANNPVWILRNKEIIELQPDKMPIGKHDKDSEPFTQHEFNLQKGDIIYTLTDGMPDQFGGTKGKKYKYSRFKEFLISIGELPLMQQREKLVQEFNEWKGELEQLDDVCVIGVKI